MFVKFINALLLLLSVIYISSVGAYENRLLSSSTSKSTKGPTLKSTKSPTSKSTKAPTLKSTKGPTLKSTKGPKSTKAPTTKSTSSSTSGGGGGGTGTDVFVSIGAVNFDDLAEDADVGTYRGLIFTSFQASATVPAPPSPPRAAVPIATSTSVELASGVFSLSSIDIAGAPVANPITIRGFNSAGVQTVSTVINPIAVYQTFDLSQFANIARITFSFAAVSNTGLDNWIFL